MTARRALVTALLVALAGCHADPTALDPVVVLRAAPPSGVVRDEDLVPAAGTTYAFTAYDEGRTSSGALRVEATDEHGARLRVDQGDGRIEFIADGDDGALVMPAVLETERRALSLFEPPLVVAWPELEADVERTSEATITVVDSRRPTRVKERGTATRRIRYVADERIRTEAGEYDARVVEIEFLADLRLADAERLDRLWVVPGMGVVARRFESSIAVLGLPGNRSTGFVIRVPDAAPAPSAGLDPDDGADVE